MATGESQFDQEVCAVFSFSIWCFTVPNGVFFKSLGKIRKIDFLEISRGIFVRIDLIFFYYFF